MKTRTPTSQTAKPGDDEVTLPPLLPAYQECDDLDDHPDFRRQLNLPLLAHSVMLYGYEHDLSEQQARNLGSAFAGECAAVQESLARDIKTMDTLSKEDRLELFRQWQTICRDLREAVRESLRTRRIDWDAIVQLVERHSDVMQHLGLCETLHLQDRIMTLKARLKAERRAWARGLAKRLVDGISDEREDGSEWEVPWNENNVDFMGAREARATFSGGRPSEANLSRLLGRIPVHFMRKPGRGSRVHVGEFRSWAAKKFGLDEQRAAIADEYIADVEARKAHERASKRWI